MDSYSSDTSDYPNNNGVVGLRIGYLTDDQKTVEPFSTTVGITEDQMLKQNSTHSEERVQLLWKNLSYSVRLGIGICDGGSEQEILQPQSGQLTGGSITALMGPSGAGKTTLLNCIAGKIRPSVGQIIVKCPRKSGYENKAEDIRIGFVPQSENLFMQFSVRETVMFASRLNNSDRHAERVHQTLVNLDLVSVADLRLSRLSGGQLKRTSVAVELVSGPKILMLDEPTSGLDSDNSEKLVRLLKQLAQTLGSDAPAIVATIHQPSIDSFFLFDEVYLLNRFGCHIYSGAPQEVVGYITNFKFPEKTDINPAEYMIEVANAKYGADKFELMAEEADQAFRRSAIAGGPGFLIESLPQKRNSSFMWQLALLSWRNISAYCIKSPVTVAQMFLNVLTFFFLISIRETPSGLEDGCWSKMHNLSIPISEGGTGRTFFSTITEKIWDIDFKSLMLRSSDCSMFVYIVTIYFLYIPATAAVTYFPIEIKTVRRELFNNWYSVTAYFFAKLICNPLILIVANIPAVAYVYFASGFPAQDYFRFGLLFMTTMLLAAIWDCRGFFFSVLFKGDTLKAVLTANGLILVLFLLSGFYVKQEALNDVVKPLSYVSDMKYGYSSVVASLYGFNRCNITGDLVSNNLLAKKDMKRAMSKVWSTFNVTVEDGRRMSLLIGMEESFFDPVFTAARKYVGPYQPNDEDGDLQPSFVMHFNRVSDADLWFGTYCLLVSLLVSQVATYVALLVTTRSQKL